MKNGRKIHKGNFLWVPEHQIKIPILITINPVNGRGGRLAISKTGFEVMRRNQKWGHGLKLTPQEFLDKLLA